MKQVTELHLHDHYSFLDGYNTPEEYMVRAKELGMTHLAQTNHGTLSGHRAFQRAAKDAGITPILGLEAYISATDRFDRRSKKSRQDGTQIYNHIILLAQDEVGLKTLNRLSQKAWEEGFYYKPRIDTELLFGDNEGLIVLSGCLNGLISKAIESGDKRQAEITARTFKDVLGDRFYIEVQGHNPQHINEGLFDIADKVGIKPVTTSDCHYARKEELFMEQAMLIVASSPKMKDGATWTHMEKMDLLDRYNYLYPDRMMNFEEYEIFLRSYTDHADWYSQSGFDRVDMLENTMEVAARIGEYPYYEGLDILPNPTNEDPDVHLRRLVFEGLKKKGVAESKPHIERAEYELDIIKTKGFARYFIVLKDIVDFADSKKIRRGPGRGSAASSIVNWSLDASKPDPIFYGLPFSRFIDLGRDDWPDVDMDFDDSRRHEVVQFVIEKYGHAAAIATFTTYAGKNAINDAAKATGAPLSDTRHALKNNNAPPDADYLEFFLASDKGKEYAKKYPDVITVARGMMGRIRNGGKHPAGIVVSSVPLETIAPVETADDKDNKGGPRQPYIALDMNEVAAIGGIKFDILGLKNLRIIDETLKSVKERHGIDVDIDNIPLDDANVYKMLAEGHTTAVFQAEGGTFTQWILNNKCTEFMDLVNGTSISRPGARETVGEIYRRRLMGEESWTYPNKIIYEITKDTYGCVIFQEQVMSMITDLAGMTSSEANKIRKIIGKKLDKAEFEPYKVKFVEGASRHVSVKEAERLWSDFEHHAGYSFNLSHAVAYSMITYQTAWLKYHYPLEYMAAALLAEEKKEKITTLLIEIKRLGLPVYLPHINYSNIGTEIQDGGIRLGLSQIKYVSEGISKNVIKWRPYKNYAEFANKVMEKYSGMNSRMLDSINKVGAAEFYDNPLTGNERDHYFELLHIPAFSYKNVPGAAGAVVTKLIDYDELEASVVIGVVSAIKRGTGWSKVDILDETGTATIFAGEHTPVEDGKMYAMLIANKSLIKFIEVENIGPDEGMLCKLLYGHVKPAPEDRYRVIALHERTTKEGKKMGTVILMDEDGTLGWAIVFPTQYARSFMYLTDDKIVNLELRQKEDGTVIMNKVVDTHGW